MTCSTMHGDIEVDLLYIQLIFFFFLLMLFHFIMKHVIEGTEFWLLQNVRRNSTHQIMKFIIWTNYTLLLLGPLLCSPHVI